MSSLTRRRALNFQDTQKKAFNCVSTRRILRLAEHPGRGDAMNDLDNTELNDQELRIRVLYAFIQASAELGAAFGVGLKAFERLSHMAAFHVLRDANGSERRLTFGGECRKSIVVAPTEG